MKDIETTQSIEKKRKKQPEKASRDCSLRGEMNGMQSDRGGIERHTQRDSTSLWLSAISED